MVRTGLALLLALTVGQAFAQTDDNPVVWSFSLGQQDSVHALLAQAEVADGWYVYSQFLDEGGPVPTTLDLSTTPGLTLRGEAMEDGNMISGFDQMFEMEVTKFKQVANFSQAFDLAPEVTEIVGTLQFMACTELKCLPPRTLDISLAINE